MPNSSAHRANLQTKPERYSRPKFSIIGDPPYFFKLGIQSTFCKNPQSKNFARPNLLIFYLNHFSMRVYTEEGNNFHGFISDDINIMFVSHMSSFSGMCRLWRNVWRWLWGLWWIWIWHESLW